MTRENVEMKAGSAPRGQQESLGTGWSYLPRTDITESADEFTILADMPGTTADGLRIDFENRTLTIRGTVQMRQPADVHYVTHEYGIGDFDREFVLPDVVNAEKISAEYENGVLIVHLPKSEEAKPRRIPVQKA
jgi:HSP20 family protein